MCQVDLWFDAFVIKRCAVTDTEAQRGAGAAGHDSNAAETHSAHQRTQTCRERALPAPRVLLSSLQISPPAEQGIVGAPLSAVHCSKRRSRVRLPGSSALCKTKGAVKTAPLAAETCPIRWLPSQESCPLPCRCLSAVARSSPGRSTAPFQQQQLFPDETPWAMNAPSQS